MAFKVALSDFARLSALGVAIVLTIPELALLAIFTRYTTSQGSIYTFEVMGLVISCLTLLLLPVLIFGPHILRSSPFSLPVFEIPLLSVLSGMWLAFITLEVKEQNKWYPIPKAYQNHKDVSGCQFLPPGGQEVYWCNQLTTISTLMILILVFILLYTSFLVVIALVCQLGGTPVWTRPVDDVFDWNDMRVRRHLRQPQQVSEPRSQPTVYNLFGDRWKKGEKAGVLSAETASM